MRVIEHHSGTPGQEVQQAALAAAAEQLWRAAADAVAGHLRTQAMHSSMKFLIRLLHNIY